MNCFNLEGFIYIRLNPTKARALQPLLAASPRRRCWPRREAWSEERWATIRAKIKVIYEVKTPICRVKRLIQDGNQLVLKPVGFNPELMGLGEVDGDSAAS